MSFHGLDANEQFQQSPDLSDLRNQPEHFEPRSVGSSWGSLAVEADWSCEPFVQQPLVQYRLRL